MSFKDSKVVIVGVGNVGATTAYSILNQGISEEVVLIDVNKEKAIAEALDMQHSIYFMNRNMSVKAGDYSDCRDADVVVITASAPMPKDSNNRLEMLSPSMKIIKNIVENVMANGFDGVFVVISNPVDIMAYYVWKLSRLPKNRIIGSGTTLDTARLCCELSKMYNLLSIPITIIAGDDDKIVRLKWSKPECGHCEVKGKKCRLKSNSTELETECFLEGIVFCPISTLVLNFFTVFKQRRKLPDLLIY